MLTLPRSVRIYLATGPVDLRKSIDGLGALAKAHAHDIFSGHLFVFTSKRGDRIKILVWDTGGFVLYYKRLERGRFKLPAVATGAAEVRTRPISRVVTRAAPPAISYAHGEAQS